MTKNISTMIQILTNHLLLSRPAAAALALLSAPAAAQTLTATSGADLTVQSGAVLYVEGGLQTASGATLTNAGTL